MQTSSNVISFAAFANARRAGAEIAILEAGRVERIEAKVDAVLNTLESKFGRPMPLGAQQAIAIAVGQSETPRQYMPAYCDPSNEVRGSKYEATRSLDIAEIAKRMRADIKALNLGKGFKVSVRIQRFSGGQSIDISATPPECFTYYSAAYTSWVKQFGGHRNPPLTIAEQHSGEFNALRERLDAIHDSYNRDNSDSMSDYFNCRYYGSANIDGTWEALKREAAASAGNHWAAGDCD